GKEAQVTLNPGRSTVFAGQVLRYQGLRTDQQPQRIVLTATVSVTNPSGGTAGTLDPRMNLYPAATEPIGSPSIRRGIIWDLYASVISLQDNGGPPPLPPHPHRLPPLPQPWRELAVVRRAGNGARRRRSRVAEPSATELRR